jgi:hypothetical protein
VDFADKDPLYAANLPADVRQKMDALVKRIRTGALALEVAEL